jgi:hypothetical protein
MAVVIKADCPGCGVVRLGTGDLTVRVCADDGSGAYCFRCRNCGAAVNHVATPSVCELLVMAGCRQVEWRWPEELSERRDGPALTVDDLLDFHVLLRDDEWSARLAALTDTADSG